MKSPATDPVSIRESVIIVRTRGVELTASERAALHQAGAALGRVFRRIHRIEWKLAAQPQGIEARCEIRALSGVFAASAREDGVRASLQTVTQQILKQKRRAKETGISRRRTGA